MILYFHLKKIKIKKSPHKKLGSTSEIYAFQVLLQFLKVFFFVRIGQSKYLQNRVEIKKIVKVR